MSQRNSIRLAVAFALAALLPVPRAGAGQQPPPVDGFPGPINWNLQSLSQGPVKLVKAGVDPQTGQVRFLVEFTRPLKPSERLDWEHNPPFQFRFLDADGVVLQTLQPRYEGQIVPKAGWRFRLVLPTPDQRLLALTRSIVVD
jgi:hypothetical protein